MNNIFFSYAKYFKFNKLLIQKILLVSKVETSEGWNSNLK